MNPENSMAQAKGNQDLSVPARGLLGKDIPESTFRRWLTGLFLLGLIIRLGYFVEHWQSPSFAVPSLDEKYYDTVARMLVGGGDLHELHGFRPLLYPMFLAVFYKAGGNAGPALAIFAQHFLGVATAIIVAFLGTRLFRDRRCGIAAGFLYLLAPVPLAFEGELLIEASYTFLICAGLLLHLNAAEKQGWKAGAFWLMSGAWIVLTSQARANILVFLGVYPLLSGWRWIKTRKTGALRPLLGLLGAFCMMVPWGVINMKQSDHFHLLPGAGGVNFYIGNKRGADGMMVGEDVIKNLSKLSIAGTNGSGVPITQRRIDSGGRYQDLVEVWADEEYEADMRSHGKVPNPDPIVISSYWTHRTLDEIRAAPVAWLGLVVKKCWFMCWNAEIPNNKDFRFLRMEFLSLQVLPIRWVVLFMLAPVGIWAAGRRQYADSLFILLVYAGVYAAGNVVFFICDRYRYPVYPVMAVFAGGGVYAALHILKGTSQNQKRGLVVTLILMASISLPTWMGNGLPTFAQDYFFRSSACYEKGYMNQALADVDRSIALNPSEAEPQHHRGNVLFALERFADARLAYESAIQLAPGDSGVWNNLGATLSRLGDTTNALQAYQKATECSLPSLNAFLGLATLQIRMDHLDEAAATLGKLKLLQHESSAMELALRSAIARKQGDTVVASQLEQKACETDVSATRWILAQLSAP